MSQIEEECDPGTDSRIPESEGTIETNPSDPFLTGKNHAFPLRKSQYKRETDNKFMMSERNNTSPQTGDLG